MAVAIYQKYNWNCFEKKTKNKRYIYTLLSFDCDIWMTSEWQYHAMLGLSLFYKISWVSNIHKCPDDIEDTNGMHLCALLIFTVHVFLMLSDE